MRKIILSLFIFVFAFGYKYSMALAEDVDMSDEEQAEIESALAKAKAEEKAADVKRLQPASEEHHNEKAAKVEKHTKNKSKRKAKK